jgi:hypothetical protein
MRVSRRTFLSSVAAVPLVASGDRRAARCEVVDLGCVLPESMAGFKTQVGDLRHDVLVVPAVRTLTGADSAMLARWLDRGAIVLLEDVAGARVEQNAYFPYVDYHWPVQAKIREFAPTKLTPAPEDEIIATFLGQPVGLRRRAGNGTLVTLGSPLGPIFLTGDFDAARWFDALKSSSVGLR